MTVSAVASSYWSIVHKASLEVEKIDLNPSPNAQGAHLFSRKLEDSPLPVNWDAIVKTYDVRGLVGIDLTEDVVEALGAGFVDELGV
ncbi:MAG: phosphomannomutase/phosphoglucomutase, partial [Actinomycetota bacterium]